MAVAVAPDPGAEAHAGPVVGILQQGGVEGGILPGIAQAFVELLEGEGENLAQIEVHAPAFGGDPGFFQEDFSGAPQALEDDFDFLADGLPLGGGERLVLEGSEKQVDGAVLFEHGGAFRFGRVGGEDGFDADGWQEGGDLVAGESLFFEAGELLSPESGFGGQAVLDFALTAGLGGGVLLDHVEELEGDRVGLLDTGGRFVDIVR